MTAAARDACCAASTPDDPPAAQQTWLAALRLEDTERYEAVELFMAPQEVVRRIEGAMLSVLRCAADPDTPLHLAVTSRAHSNTSAGQAGDVRVGRRVKVIGRRGAGTQKLSRLLRTLAFLHGMVSAGKNATQRDIFYCLADAFRSQRELNEVLQECVCLLGCSRLSMNVSAASRGFVAGRATWQATPATPAVDLTALGSQGMAIPGHLPSCLRLSSHAAYVLIVEKDCFFQQLCEARVWDRIDCVVLTGCGFPDVNTRVVAWQLCQRTPPPVVLGLVDYNPFGVSVLMTYRHGSQGMGLEMFRYTLDVRWLGVHRTDAEGLPSVPLSSKDEAVRQKLLGEGDAVCAPAWQRELAQMDRKVELQCVYNAFKAPQNVDKLQEKIVKREYL